MAKPSLRQLDIFAQMVASGSVARCARDLGIAVEDVVQDIALLEMRLGYRLFDDLHGVARLTPAGHKTAQAMTLLSQNEPEQWRESSAPTPPMEAATPAPPPSAVKSPRRSVTLGAPPPVFGHFQEALAAFEEANDDLAITLDLQILLATDARDALEADRVDIAYFYTLAEPPDFLSRYGWSEQISLYAGSYHPLARRELVSLGDVEAAPMLAMDPRNGMRRIVEEALQRGGIMPVRPVLESDNLFEVISALKDGAGWIAAFGPLARDLGRMDGIRRLALDTALPAVEVRQAVSARAAEKPAVQALADYLFL